MGDPRVSACLSVGLSLLCLGWPCFRFRGFEKSWLGWGRGAWVGILGAPASGKSTWSGAHAWGVAAKERARCCQDSATVLGTSEARPRRLYSLHFSHALA